MSPIDWTNEHDWGTPEDQQAESDAPDDRKVTRWAVLASWNERNDAIRARHHTHRSHAIGVKQHRDAMYTTDAPHRIVRLDITISEEPS